MKVTYEFNLPDDQGDLNWHQNASKMFIALDEIYNLARTQLKHGESLGDEADRILEQIKSIASFVQEIEG